MTSKKSCSKQNTAKFKRRKSPPYNSSDCKDRKMKGNDGTMWESIKRKDGVYTWRRLKKQTKASNSCRKQSSSKYKRRKSPPYEARDCKGKEMKGNDGTIWISSEKKDGSYMWKRSKSKPGKPSKQDKEDKKPKKGNNYSIQITKDSKLTTIDITNKMQNYIDKNYSNIKKITPKISDDLADKIIKFVNQSRLTATWKEKGFYQAYTSWKWSWYKFSYNKSAHVSIDVEMFVPKIRKIDQPVFNKWFKKQFKGLQCHEEQHRDIVFNGADKLGDKLRKVTQAQLIKDFSKICSEYFAKMNQDNVIFDEQTTHGCVLHSGKGQFFNKCEIECNLY